MAAPAPSFEEQPKERGVYVTTAKRHKQPLKRRIYGLPIMQTYRDWRTAQLAADHRDHPLGFRFAGFDIFFKESWEPQERAIIDEHLSPTSVFVDVGAMQGFYTCFAASKGLEVAAIEPEPGNVRFLLSNITENGFNVEVFPVAVSSKAGAAMIYGDGDMSSLVSGWARYPESFSQRVATNTLDNLFGDRWMDRPILLKVDVEGHELAVLQGAQRLLSRNEKPTWLIETFPFLVDENYSANPDFVQLFEMMFDAGYNAVRTDNRSRVSLHDVRLWAGERKSADVGRSNYLFTASRH